MKKLKLIKWNTVLINAGRGEIIVENELIDAVKNGIIRGAGLDVVCGEPPDPESEVLKTDGIIVTLHISYLSAELMIELKEAAVLNAVKALKNMRVENNI